jgi:integrase
VRGHIAKKGDRYYAVIYEGIDPSTQRQRHRWYAAGPRRRDAEKLLAELVKKQHDGDYRSPERITLGDYLTERWLPAKRAQLRASTFDSYGRNVELHVIPALGAHSLQRLTPEDLDAFYADLLATGRKDGRGGLSIKTVRYIHLIVHKALADANRKGTVVRNVGDLADPPKLSSRPKRETRVWNAEQLRSFLAGIEDHWLYAAIYLAANTGMRRGEVLGLRWKDVDLEGGRLSVRQAVVSVAYKMQVSDAKSGSGRRSIDLDPRTIAILRSWRTEQLKERLAKGAPKDESGFVFARTDGSPLHPDLLSQSFDRLAAHSSLPRISLHDLRHTHATILLKAGVPVKVVSERLGHSSPAFTMTVYQHVLPGMQADAAKAFSQAVFGETAR